MALRKTLTSQIHKFRLSSAPIRAYTTSPDSIADRGAGFFNRILQRRALNNHSSLNLRPDFIPFPVGDKLRESLWGINIATDPRIGGQSLPELTVKDMRKIMRAAQVEAVRERLRSVPESAVSYAEFVGMCGEACGGEEGRSLELAKVLDETAGVFVWGDVVFLRPEQVAKSMESLIRGAIGMPKDPRKQELEEMEKHKAQIDKRAHSLVRKELYFGLGLLLAQTVGFMRLTFWELSWDVMEPICFFVTSIHFAFAYSFFLRTSTEPSFEGFFRARFRSKQAQLMTIHRFDVDRYQRLSKMFYRPDDRAVC